MLSRPDILLSRLWEGRWLLALSLCLEVSVSWCSRRDNRVDRGQRGRGLSSASRLAEGCVVPAAVWSTGVWLQFCNAEQSQLPSRDSGNLAREGSV